MMLLTKMKLATLFVATVGAMGVLAAPFFAPAKKTLAKEIRPLNNDIGDVASLLHVQKEVYEVELRPKIPFARMSVDIEIYKDGQKQKTRLSGPTFKVDAGDRIDRVKVALLAADLDFLPLADAVKGHHRVQVKIEIKGFRSEGSTDVPKELFDFSHLTGAGPFRLEAGSATEAPLLFLKARSRTLTANTDTVSEFIKKNSEGDVLIVYLRVRKE